MNPLERKLTALYERDEAVNIMIIGLGSVGNYLLSSLCGMGLPSVRIVVTGHNREKLEENVNIARIAASIRGELHSKIVVDAGCDLERPEEIKACIARHRPDIIVNTSRVYAGLKYGTISWKNLRAYGIWTPLSIRYIRNIAWAAADAAPEAILINTSYSDVVIPWLKSAGQPYPDFGSGNLNHLIPRLRFAAAQLAGILDFWNIEVSLATGHFHDVVISKEGHNEGVPQLIHLSYHGETLSFPEESLLALCKLPMPSDSRRNQMNAASNYEIINGILSAVWKRRRVRLHCPGVFGELGGYPVILDGTGDEPKAYLDETHFTLSEMRERNRRSLYLDGVERVEAGALYYTDALIQRVKERFQEELPKVVPFEEIDAIAEWLVERIIRASLA